VIRVIEMSEAVAIFINVVMIRVIVEVIEIVTLKEIVIEIGMIEIVKEKGIEIEIGLGILKETEKKIE
jgi:hypothetical protein